ncbi:MAG: ATP-binding protein [Desulfuromonadaceae bacterium]|nr:ATP-binding protein [Desulfuromonadaceae bacterium]
MSPYRPGLTVSIMAFLGFLLLLTWLLFSLLAFKTATNDLYAQKGEHARTLLAAFVSQLPETIPAYPEGLIPFDSSASIYVQKLSNDAAFTRLTLLDINDKPIFTAGREGIDVYLPFSGQATMAEGIFIRPDGSGISNVISISRNGVPVGRAGLLMSLAPEKARLNRSRQMLIAYFVLDFVLLLGLGSFMLARIVVNPINRLLAATEKITGGNYGQRLRVSGSAELASLADSFNEMSAALLNKDRQVFEHLTALEQANSHLHQAREEAIRTEKMASIGLLAAGMAHEIGTPLASIMGYTDLVSAELPDNTAIQDYTRRISDDCARIDRIVRGLLDYARPPGSSEVSTNIRQVVTASLDLLTQQGVLKHINVSTEIDEGFPEVMADPHQLEQVLVNLLLNSRDALPDEDGLLTVSARFQDGEVWIDILDNGSGIADEHLKHIFDPFFTTKPPGKGTGLGLAISARIIEGFGGRITVTSTPGAGSRFSVCLPVAQSSLL